MKYLPFTTCTILHVLACTNCITYVLYYIQPTCIVLMKYLPFVWIVLFYDKQLHYQ